MKLTKSQLKEIISEVLDEMSPTSWKAGTTYENDEDVNETNYEKIW